MTSKDRPSPASLPTGPAWAAVLASGIGCASFGILSLLSEVFKAKLSPILSFYKPSGDLSGKSTLGVVAWLVAWGILHALWRGRNIQRPGAIIAISVILILLALLLVFPPFVELFPAS